MAFSTMRFWSELVTPLARLRQDGLKSTGGAGLFYCFATNLPYDAGGRLRIDKPAYSHRACLFTSSPSILDARASFFAVKSSACVASR
jgi:hypothetical protein